MGAALKRDGFDVYITTRSGVKAVAPSVPKPAPTIKVGSKVRVRQGARDYDRGLQLHSEVYRTTYDVIQIRGDRIVIGLGSSVTTAVHKDNLFLA